MPVNEKKPFDPAVFFLLFFCAVFFFCGRAHAGAAPGDGPGEPGAYNVILIVFDSVRADHLGCYGYAKQTTPCIDRFAEEGALFEQAISPSTWSLPSHCSILTSQYVPSHGVDCPETRLSDEELTLGDILRVHGYETAAFTGGFWISSVFNAGKGFNVYRDNLTFGKLKDTGAQALDWLREHKDSRFFLLLQGFDGHSPFELSEEFAGLFADPAYNGIFKNIELDHRIGDRLSDGMYYLDYDRRQKVRVTDADIAYIISQYDGAIASADRFVGVFLKKIGELGLQENTIVILTSYHGTPLFEYGVILRRLHGGPMEGSVRVPLIVRHPGVPCRGLRFGTQVQLIDVMPTILEWCGIRAPHQAQGTSLVSLVAGRPGPRPGPYAYITGFKEIALRTERWKLIANEDAAKPMELYDLSRDPLETRDLAGEKREVALGLKDILGDWLRRQEARRRAKPGGVTDGAFRKKTEDEMKRAGYWFLGAPADQEVRGRPAAPAQKSAVPLEAGTLPPENVTE